MKILKALLLLVLMFSARVLADQNLLGEKHQDPLLESELLKKDGKYQEAEKILSNLIAGASHNDSNQTADATISTDYYTISLSYLYLSRAGCWYSLKQYDEALKDYTVSYALKENRGSLFFIADLLIRET